MKKTKLSLLSMLLVVGLISTPTLTSAAFVLDDQLEVQGNEFMSKAENDSPDVPIYEEEQISIEPQNMELDDLQNLSMASTRTIKGTFTDFFPDENFASIVARNLGKDKTAEISLFELQKVTSLWIDASTYDIYIPEINLEGIGYLMGLEDLTIGGTDNIDFSDGLSNCFQLKQFTLYDSSAAIPVQLLETSLETLYIGSYRNTKKLPKVPQAIIDKYENRELNISYKEYITEDGIEIQTGEEIDLMQEIPPVIISLLKNSSRSNSLNIHGRTQSLYFHYDPDTFNNSIEEFLSHVSLEAAVLFKNEGNYSITISIFDSPYLYSLAPYYEIPVTVTKAPLKRQLCTDNIPTLDGKHFVRIYGSVQGHFSEGSNSLDLAEINSQNLTLMIDEVGRDLSNIMAITVAVSNDQIVSMTIVGMYEGSLFIIVQ